MSEPSSLTLEARLVPMIRSLLGQRRKVGVVVANSAAITGQLLDSVGVHRADATVFAGLESFAHFRSVVLDESGKLDSEAMGEVTQACRELLVDHLNELDSKVKSLQNGGSWESDAASAYAGAHTQWLSAAREFADGVAAMSDAAQKAHGRYTSAVDVNRRMLQSGQG